MSQDNVEKVRKLAEDFNRRDFDAALAALADNVTWEPFLSRAETRLLRGKDRIRAAWEGQAESLDLRGEPDEFIPVGDDMVVVPTRLLGRGSGSEMSLTASVTWLVTFGDDGLGTSIQAFDSREDALKAARSRA